MKHLLDITITHHPACLYQDQRQLQQAELLLLRALSIRELVLSPEHPITTISTHQLARLYSAQQHWSKAETFYQRTLAIREQTFGLMYPAMQSIVKSYTCFLCSLQWGTEA